MEKFAIGMLIGAMGGALVVTNSYRMRSLLKKGQDEVLTKMNDAMDEKLNESKQRQTGK